MTARILIGDCITVMRRLGENSVDSIVCDPPYGIGFMGKGWDKFKARDTPMARRAEIHTVNTGVNRQGGRQRASGDFQKRYVADMRAFQAWCELWAVEALRVLKPGGHLLAFGATRTYHRMACAVEDVGFEIRDQIGWLYSSGFPKSKNIAKQLAKDGAPAELVAAWSGWGTALKPAWEPIVMARKPSGLTITGNSLEWSVGGLNIDASRIPGKPGELGRWPANVIHDGSDDVVAAFPVAPGQMAHVKGSEPSKPSVNAYGKRDRVEALPMRTDGGGSAARFYYVAKASPRDRHDGLADPGPQFKQGRTPRDAEKVHGKGQGNPHPTLKPTDLMRHLVGLVTPRGGTVLDPFMGSGSTLKAADLIGVHSIGIEQDARWVDIARRRIGADSPLLRDVTIEVSA